MSAGCDFSVQYSGKAAILKMVIFDIHHNDRLFMYSSYLPVFFSVLSVDPITGEIHDLLDANRQMYRVIEAHKVEPAS